MYLSPDKALSGFVSLLYTLAGAYSERLPRPARLPSGCVRSESTLDSPASLLAARAERAIELATDSPRRARRLAEAVLVQARAAHDAEPAALAERALGLAALELKQGGAAVAHLRRAARIAARAQLEVREAEARMSLGRALLYAGDSRGAFREIDRASSSLTGIAAARLQFQRAILLHHHHRLDEALAGYRSSLVAFRRAGDRLWEARALNNRGLIHGSRGSLPAAEADLRAAAQLYSTLALDLALADVEHNLGWVAARRGDVPAALAWYDRSQERRRAAGVPLANGLSDRCELLLSVRLVAEARAAAEQAVAELTSGRIASETAEARLMLAEAALLDGDHRTAQSEATAAARSFARQSRSRWAALARYTALRASLLEEGASIARLRAARRAAAALAQAGWAVAALDAQLLTARIALALGRKQLARRELARIRVSARDPIDLRVRARHASALLAVAEGRRRAAFGALRAGIRLLDEHRATLGATELRAQVTGQAEELARLGLRLAIEDADPLQALAWSEQWRAGALRLRPVRPPDNDALANDLAELRRVVGAGQGEGVTAGEARELRRRQAELEHAIRRRARRTPGSSEGATGLRSVTSLEPLLGDCALVAYLELDGLLHAVTLAEGQARLHTLLQAAEPYAELEALRFALRRLARHTTAPATRAAALAAASYAAARLDETILRPLASALGDRSLVIVPTGKLHAMPWSIAPSLTGRSLTVAPSAAAWAAAEERRRATDGRRKRVTVAAGPGLPLARAEARSVAQRYDGAELLIGPSARAADVLAALEAADVAHLAAHGNFRADNPLFSSISLADGPLTVYDLESLHEAPRLCILSACESALSEVSAGDELMGLSATLLALGTATIIASVVEVPDTTTRALMSGFHRRLAAGLRPGEALAQAQAAMTDGSDLVARAGFVCFGAG
jgi:hypothetical protein